jgi:hypothetical protein
LAGRTSSSSRPSLAVLLGLVGVLAVPAAVAYSRYSSSFRLLDAVWAIPVAGAASVCGLLMVRGTAGHVRFTRTRIVRLARILAVAGICVTLSAAIAVGFYELLVRLEG